MKKATVPWLIMGPEPHLATCQRCGKQEAKPELPADVEAVLLYLRYIMERHRYCEEVALKREGT